MKVEELNKILLELNNNKIDDFGDGVHIQIESMPYAGLLYKILDNKRLIYRCFDIMVPYKDKEQDVDCLIDDELKLTRILTDIIDRYNRLQLDLAKERQDNERRSNMFNKILGYFKSPINVGVDK